MAEWIWKQGDRNPDTYMCFVKDFECETIPAEVTARIAAESKYRLWVNGRVVVFEGGQKRGQSPSSIYFDEIDLSRCFAKGINRIAIQVRYFGRNGFSHVSAGQGGLYFDAEIGGQRISTGADWKVKRNEAYDIPGDGEGPNFRLPESDTRFDASLDPGDWFSPSFDVSGWEAAMVYGDGSIYGTPVKRTIPLFRYSALKDYVNSGEVRDLHTENDTVLDMRLPYNAQFLPYLRVNAEPGRIIKIRTENYYTNAPGENCLKCIYVTKGGVQEYEFSGWINGEHAIFEIPAGVTVLELRYRETEYAVSPAGSFRCEDAFLNRLWDKCYRTLHICMRDTFMDCPNRERAQWWADANIEMEMALHCMNEGANALYENGAATMVKWYEATGIMQTVVPSGNMLFELPFQNLAGICGFVEYYRHTGNMELLRSVYDMSRDYVMRFEISGEGLVVHRAGSWDWPDWGTNADITVMENAWYCMALGACADMAELLERNEDAAFFKARSDGIAKAMHAKQKNGLYYNHTDNGMPDDRANALTVLAGFDRGTDDTEIIRALESVENASPYMEKYVYEALCELGRVDAALVRMRRRYDAMTRDSYSTLWELWNKESSLNHGWSGGPMIIMSKYIAGIRAESYNRYRIAPQLCGLKKIDCTVPTRLGALRVQIEREENRIQVTYPEGLTVTVVPPESEEDKKWNIVLKSM